MRFSVESRCRCCVTVGLSRGARPPRLTAAAEAEIVEARAYPRAGPLAVRVLLGRLASSEPGLDRRPWLRTQEATVGGVEARVFGRRFGQLRALANPLMSYQRGQVSRMQCRKAERKGAVSLSAYVFVMWPTSR